MHILKALFFVSIFIIIGGCSTSVELSGSPGSDLWPPVTTSKFYNLTKQTVKSDVPVSFDISSKSPISQEVANSSKSSSEKNKLLPLSPDEILILSVGELAKQLDRNIVSQHRGRKTTVTTIVDLNDINHASFIGSVLSEALMHELAVRSWSIVDVRANVGLILNETGEFLLTRDSRRSHINHSDGLVVTGTFMATTDGVLVNLKVLDAVTSQVLSTAQTRLENSVFLSRLATKPLASKTMRLSN